MDGGAIEIPRLRTLLRHAGPHLLEATLAPLALFYLALWLVGVWGALSVGVLWSYGAIARRLLTGRRVPGILAIGSMLVTARALVSFLSGSVYVYFLQPTIGTVLVAGAFLLSVPTGQPLAERLAADFCPLPESVMQRPFVRRFFIRITLLWAGVYLTNAAVSLWLLLSQPIGTYVIVKQVLSLIITGSAIALSTVWFKRSMRRHGVRIGFAPRAAA